MFSPNQLYDYLRYYCYVNKLNISVLHFLKNGSKSLDDLSTAYTPFVDSTRIDAQNISPHLFRETSGCLSMFDQEPIDINAYYNDSVQQLTKINPYAFRLSLTPSDFVFSKSLGVYNPIIGISEINSNDVRKFVGNFHIPMFFWSNAITSRYWFSHLEPLSKIEHTKRKRFGAYIRDTSGTRLYRKELLLFLQSKRISPNVFCPFISNNNINISSVESATITWPDHNKFDIQIIPETLFDTEKIHLTEKIFKPIVMYQPFILLSGPMSLEYIKNYGFKTFGEIWDESYDNELNSSVRFAKIKKLIKKISMMDERSYKNLITKTEEIVKFNRNHFFSNSFKNTLMNELHNNLTMALERRNEEFHTMPGGTLFHYHDMYFKKYKKLPNLKSFYVSRERALRYVYSKSKSVGDAIVKKYNHLL